MTSYNILPEHSKAKQKAKRNEMKKCEARAARERSEAREAQDGFRKNSIKYLLAFLLYKTKCFRKYIESFRRVFGEYFRKHLESI